MKTGKKTIEKFSFTCKDHYLLKVAQEVNGPSLRIVSKITARFFCLPTHPACRGGIKGRTYWVGRAVPLVGTLDRNGCLGVPPGRTRSWGVRTDLSWTFGEITRSEKERLGTMIFDYD